MAGQMEWHKRPHFSSSKAWVKNQNYLALLNNSRDGHAVLNENLILEDNHQKPDTVKVPFYSPNRWHSLLKGTWSETTLLG